MAGKLVANGLFESSRIILPEHRERLLEHKREQQRREKPVLDEQAIEEIVRALAVSYAEKMMVDLILFDPFKYESVSGIVIGINRSQNKVNLLLEEDERSIEIAKIISANL
ncbi:YolD-like family protein [Paenibacillus sp. 7516]|uniref:YolD-like family protein n=1 Tax=Paenibacillus sp. 7516 TaxID=2022549 RepID=UPI000BA58B40|nr:YolD-like family protein [Paenibacillus sp. 7516]PAF31845.1 hypothetical protein CHI14_09330 [Paenibacillus sp. 7516]